MIIITIIQTVFFFVHIINLVRWLHSGRLTCVMLQSRKRRRDCTQSYQCMRCSIVYCVAVWNSSQVWKKSVWVISFVFQSLHPLDTSSECMGSVHLLLVVERVNECMFQDGIIFTFFSSISNCVEMLTVSSACGSGPIYVRHVKGQFCLNIVLFRKKTLKKTQDIFGRYLQNTNWIPNYIITDLAHRTMWL